MQIIHWMNDFSLQGHFKLFEMLAVRVYQTQNAPLRLASYILKALVS